MVVGVIKHRLFDNWKGPLSGLRKLVQALTALVLVLVCLGIMNPPPVYAKLLRLHGPARHQVAPFMDILKDPEGVWTIDQIAGPSLAGSFSPVARDRIMLGREDAVYWLRFSVVAPSDSQFATGQTLPWVFDLSWPFVKQMNVYAGSVESGNPPHIEKAASGSSKRALFDAVPQQGCPTLFYLPNVTQKAKTIYIRIVPVGPLVLSPVINTMKGYQDDVSQGMLQSGVFLGVFIALSLYSLIMFTAVRENSYAWLALCIFMLGAYFAFMQPRAMDFILDMPVDGIRTAARLSFGGAMLFLGCFVRSFVGLPADTAGFRLVDRLLLVFMLSGGGLILLASVGNGWVYEAAFAFLALLAVPTMMAASLMAWGQGIRRARFVFLASMVTGGCGLGHALFFDGLWVFPPSLAHLFEFGSLCGVILLVCALGDSVHDLHRDREALRVSERRHVLLAFTDALTGLFNVRYFRIQLDLEIRRSEQLQQSFTLMMMDIDEFKRFNDCYGHLEGDRVLHHLGGLVSEAVREGDVACRYGGEEFAVILPDSDCDVAMDIHARLQRFLQQWARQEKLDLPQMVTLSIGVAEYRPGETAEDIIARADSAMYAAKQGGRNQLVVSEIGCRTEDMEYQGYYTSF